MPSSMKDIKNRIKSIEGTMQKTKAMELVAASKLRKARQRVEVSRPYYEFLRQAIDSLDVAKSTTSSVFFDSTKGGKTCYILIAGDRGLAGGYNSNLFKKFVGDVKDTDVCVVPVGKKAYEFCKRNGYEIIYDSFGVTEDVSISDCYALGDILCEKYKDGLLGSIYICYTEMISVMSQIPTTRKLLPLDLKDSGSARTVAIYEPSAESVFERVAKSFVSGSFYGALCESQASEFASRRMAMDNASKNAGEMIDTLTLNYNRARQAAITQEITEIVSGAEAL